MLAHRPVLSPVGPGGDLKTPALQKHLAHGDYTKYLVVCQVQLCSKKEAKMEACDTIAGSIHLRWKDQRQKEVAAAFLAECRRQGRQREFVLEELMRAYLRRTKQQGGR